MLENFFIYVKAEVSSSRLVRLTVMTIVRGLWKMTTSGLVDQFKVASYSCQAFNLKCLQIENAKWVLRRVSLTHIAPRKTFRRTNL